MSAREKLNFWSKWLKREMRKVHSLTFDFCSSHSRDFFWSFGWVQSYFGACMLSWVELIWVELGDQLGEPNGDLSYSSACMLSWVGLSLLGDHWSPRWVRWRPISPWCRPGDLAHIPQHSHQVCRSGQNTKLHQNPPKIILFSLLEGLALQIRNPPWSTFDTEVRATGGHLKRGSKRFSRWA